MAEETSESQPEQPQEEKPKKSKKTLLIIIAGALIVFSISGYFAYTMLISNKGNTDEGAHKKEENSKSVLVPLEPFVLNLAEQGRFLKVTMQLELTDASYQQTVTDKIPQLKDAIIILLSSKSVESISSPEGKLQLKDELLLRANQTMGKDMFKNLYFTEFVIQ